MQVKPANPIKAQIGGIKKNYFSVIDMKKDIIYRLIRIFLFSKVLEDFNLYWGKRLRSLFLKRI